MNSLTLASTTPSGGTDTHLVVTKSGNVGIGTTSPNFLLSVQSASEGNMFQLYDTDGNCRQDPDAGAITTTCSSDVRLKTDITESQAALPYLLTIPIKDYTVIASGDRRTGVIAQELLEIHPELVSVGDDGYYGVSEISSWKFVKAVQELNLKIEDLQNNFQFSISNFQSNSNDSIFNSILGWLEDKIVKAKEFVAEKITAKKARLSELEMIDKTTGEIYCTWIENGEWVKVKGECD